MALGSISTISSVQDIHSLGSITADPVNPIKFDFVSCSLAFRMFIYEIQNVYFHVFCCMVAIHVEVIGYIRFFLFCFL